MAYTQTQLDAITQSIAEGVTKVTFNGKTMEFRSLKEMEAIKTKMETEINGSISDADKAYFPTFDRSYK